MSKHKHQSAIKKVICEHNLKGVCVRVCEEVTFQ